NKAVTNFRYTLLQFLEFCLSNAFIFAFLTQFVQMCDPVYIIIHRIFTVLAQYIIISRFISFILVILSIYYRFIGETVIKQTHLRDDGVYIDVFTEQNFTRDIGIGVQILITVIFQFFV